MSSFRFWPVTFLSLLMLLLVIEQWPGAIAEEVGGADSAPVLTPVAAAQTDESTVEGDSIDDPAIWVHPTDVSRSLILGTNKKDGLSAYSLDGKLVQTVSQGARPNNVDVLYGFRRGEQQIDLAVAGVRAPGQLGVKIWSIDAATGALRDMSPTHALPCFSGSEPYGSCVYGSPRTGRCYYFVNNKRGQVEQYVLEGDAPEKPIDSRRVRSFGVSSQVEGCVADQGQAVFYLAEENVGIWRFGAEPDDGSPGRLVARVGEHGLTSNIEGLTIYYASDGRGYLIASSQGSNTFAVYQRGGDNAFVATIDPKASDQFDDVSDTDGIDTVSCPLGDRFPAGLFVAQDGQASRGHQNFKLYDWRSVASGKLLIDTSWRPRSVRKTQ